MIFTIPSLFSPFGCILLGIHHLDTLVQLEFSATKGAMSSDLMQQCSYCSHNLKNECVFMGLSTIADSSH